MSDDFHEDDLDEIEDDGLTDRLWWIQAYDDKGNAYQTPQPYSSLRKEVIEEYKETVKKGGLPTPQMTEKMLEYIAKQEFVLHVGKERNRRSRRLIDDAEYILDALPEDSAYVDPLLSQVHRVGDRTDAPLRYWTVEMWEIWADNRFAGAKAAMIAADQAIHVRQRMVAAIRTAGVTYTGDLFTPPTEEEPDVA